MKDFKYILRLTLTLLLITAVVAGLLGLVNGLTEDRIDALKREKAEQAMQEVLPAHRYDVIDFRMDGVTEAYRADNGGYVVRVSENGFGGEIDMMVGVSLDGKVCGVSIISHSETASLGANCVREDFRAQYVGADGEVKVNKDGGTIDALTGATVTSRAVTKGVNLALAFVKEVG
ncbi:MAG: RnfABCDGE type electron transport complex subunit G [Oscillospiraceae bacterium]|nr:RnfABCDGE type electron transport complex subunit G [Oscillospiraceae bacterium]